MAESFLHADPHPPHRWSSPPRQDSPRQTNPIFWPGTPAALSLCPSLRDSTAACKQRPPSLRCARARGRAGGPSSPPRRDAHSRLTHRPGAVRGAGGGSDARAQERGRGAARGRHGGKLEREKKQRHLETARRGADVFLTKVSPLGSSPDCQCYFGGGRTQKPGNSEPPTPLSWISSVLIWVLLRSPRGGRVTTPALGGEHRWRWSAGRRPLHSIPNVGAAARGCREDEEACGVIGTGSLGGKGDRKGCVHVCARARARACPRQRDKPIYQWFLTLAAH